MTSPHPGLKGRPVYLDYNATTPVDPRVVEAMAEYLSVAFGNPSSAHSYGAAAAAAVEAARADVAALLGAAAGRVVFTGSGSEADALAIRGAALAVPAPRGRRRHVITQATEHPAVLAACADLAELHDVDVTVLPVDGDGLVDPRDLAEAITGRTVLISVMHANNETGTIQPVAQITRVAHERGVLVHCDAAQSVGKIGVDVAELGVDLLTLVGHKMYAPKGVAALYVADSVRLRPLVGGGGQEFGLRAGTENVASIVGLGRAAQLAAEALADGESDRLSALRDRLQHDLESLLPDRVHLNGHPTLRLPNTLNVRIDGAPALGLLDAASGDVAASAGSACHAGAAAPSPVLTAMRLPPEQALTAIRLSGGRWTSAQEVDDAAMSIARVAAPRE